MKRKIFGSMLLLVLITALLSSALLSLVMYRQLSIDMRREMNNQLAYVEAGYSTGGMEYIKHIEGAEKNSRITLIDKGGEVLFDNRAPTSEMDNHSGRPEVIEALENGRGEAVRMSDTIGSQTYYLSTQLPDGTVLRISSTTDTIFVPLIDSAPFMILIIALILSLSLLIAGYQTKKIVSPINKLDLERPTDNVIYDELSPLLIRIHNQNMYIEKQMKELKQKKVQFEDITGNMSEGLVVLNDKGHVLSVNQSALRFLDAVKSDTIDKHYTNLNRSLILQEVIESALNGSSTEDIYESDKKYYQLSATPAYEVGRSKGVILLIRDVTEKHKAEKMRREFTANVSHELKTPLTTISGYAELLKNDMVKRDEILSFSSKIYDESTGLINLVEDIIRLSQLDERDESLAKEIINLKEVVKTVQSRLQTLAESKEIRIDIEGMDSYVFEVSHLCCVSLYLISVTYSGSFSL